MDGGGGVNTLIFGSLEGVAEVHDVDLTVDGNVIVTNFRIVESGSLAETRFVLDASSIAKLSPSSPALIRGRTGDRVVLEDLDDWLVGQARVEDGQFIRQITNVSTGQVLDLDFPMPWHNPLRPSDVNNDGVVRASDALRIINELSRQTSADSGTNDLPDPRTIVPWPGSYYDQNGDGRLTAVDALRGINELTRSTLRGNFAEGELNAIVPEQTSQKHQSQMDYEQPNLSLPPEIPKLQSHSQSFSQATTKVPVSSKETLSRIIDRLFADQTLLEQLQLFSSEHAKPWASSRRS